MSLENFLDCSPATYPSFGWLSPRISFSRELSDHEPSNMPGEKPKSPEYPPEKSDPDVPFQDIGDFEFGLEDPVNILPADELFSDGKLTALHLSTIRQTLTSTTISSPITSLEMLKSSQRNVISGSNPNLFSPKAPRGSSRWKELLGLKKLYINSTRQENIKTTPSSSSTSREHNSNTKSLKHFLHRSSKSSLDSSLNLPLLMDPDNELASVSSLTSSSLHDLDDIPMVTKKPTLNPPRVRVGIPRLGLSAIRKPADSNTSTTTRGVSVNSPRMNSSGKIVFHSLERSSSSPSSLNCGPRFKHRGMERSYSGNVRVSPVLNVPVCSLIGSSSKYGVFGFPLFSSPQKRESSGGGSKGQQSKFKNRTHRSCCA